MRRTVLVGIAAALITLLLVTAATYVEMRHTQIGIFMRDSASEMRNDHVSRPYTNKYGSPIDVLGRWARLNQFIVEPALCIVVGVFTGLLSRRVLVSSLLGVVPIAALNWPPDVLAALSIAMCAIVCWSVAAGIRHGRAATSLIANYLLIVHSATLGAR